MMIHEPEPNAPQLSTQRSKPYTAPTPARAAPRESVLGLQRMIGNQATTQWIQAKLAIGEPDDRFEREADRMAEAVVPGNASPAPAPRVEATVQRKVIASGLGAGTSSCNTCAESAASVATASEGSPLPTETARFFEMRMGTSFADVRVHTGPAAEASAQAIGALAYTAGHDIVFAAGQYPPSTTAGRRLLAHELTHVIQQGGAPREPGTVHLQLGSGHTPVKRAAHQRAGNEPLPPVSRGLATRIQRSKPGKEDDARRRKADEQDYAESGHSPHVGSKSSLELQASSELANRLRQQTGATLNGMEAEMALNGEIFTIRNNHGTILSIDYLETVIFNRSQFSKVNSAYEAALKNIGVDDFAKQQAALPKEAAAFVATVEKDFITDPNTSSLDLLPPKQRDRYRRLAWQKNDYPDGPVGPNESSANQMAKDLSAIRPERRANQGTDAVVTEAEFTKKMRGYVDAQLQPVPDFSGPGPDGKTPTQPKGRQLNKLALESFLKMREAALKEGVALIAIDAYRPPEVAASNAKKSGNRSAVAEFSTHSLGLAVDLTMSFSYQKSDGSTATRSFAETTTQPMQSVVDMRESPAHKWLFMKGAAYGWHPFQNEPWHWEYNPQGFRDTFLKGTKTEEKKD